MDKEPSSREEILRTICLTGEYPLASLSLLSSSPDALLRAAYRMEQTGLVTMVGKKDMKSIRLDARKKDPEGTTRVYKIITDTFGEEYYDNYMQVSDGHMFNGCVDKVKRHHRIAEAMIMCDRAGVEVRPWILPQLSAGSDTPFVKITGFYCSRYLKSIEGTDNLKISYGRMLGLLISPGGAYCVYNTFKGLINGSPGGELRARMFVRNVLLKNWSPPDNLEKKEDTYDAYQAVLIGKTPKVALKVLDDMSKTKSPYLQLNGTYRNIFYVPMDESGINNIRMLTQERWRERILPKVIRSDLIVDAQIRSYDAITPSGMKLLVWFDGNLSKLKNICDGNKDDIQLYTILCFPWQVEIINGYLGSEVKTKTYDEEKIKKMLERKE